MLITINLKNHMFQLSQYLESGSMPNDCHGKPLAPELSR